VAIGADLGGTYKTKEEKLAEKEEEKLKRVKKAAIREMEEEKARRYEMELINRMAHKQSKINNQKLVQTFGNVGSIPTLTSTGNGAFFGDGETTKKVNEYKTRTIRKNYKGRYYALIKVYEDNDEVYYSINRGRGLKWMTWYLPWWEFRFEGVKPRESLEATLGVTYLKIDQTLEAMKENKKHAKFVKDILKTDPDNLKMIAELDKLDKAGKESTTTSGHISIATTPWFTMKS
jgi:hypothetical protein